MFRTLINRINPTRNSIRSFSNYVAISQNIKNIEKLLNTKIEWRSYPESMLENPLCYWGKFSILLNDDPRIKEKFILTHNGEEQCRLESMPHTWTIQSACPDVLADLGISSKAIKKQRF